MEDDLHNALQRLTAHVENSPLAIIEFDPQYRITRWSAEAQRLFGWTAEEVLGKAIGEFRWVVEEDIDSVDKVSSEMLSGQNPRNLNVNRNYRKDGSIITCEWYNSALLDEHGNLVSVFSQVLDITQRKKAEEQLRQRAEELETVMNLVPVAIWVAHDPECNNITGNRTANEFYEAKEGENVSAGPAPGEPIPPRRFFRNGKELTAEELPMQEAAARNMDIQGSEFNVILPSGKSRALWGSASPLRDDDGQVRGVVAAFLDITERKQAEEELKRYTSSLSPPIRNWKLSVIRFLMTCELR